MHTNDPTISGPANSNPSHFGKRLSLFHVIILTLSFLMTIAAWQFSKRQIETRTLARFTAAQEQTLAHIRTGMRQYEDALWAGVSAVESHGGDMGLAEWRAFASKLRIDERYPGINGIGIIHFLDPSALPAYMAQRQAERPGFKIFPEHDNGVLMPISFVEPEATNLAAIGLDVAHESNRRAGAVASRTTGRAQITGPITLVQDAGSTPGFLFYAPFYGGEKSQIEGAVYAPFVVRNLVAGLLAKDARDLHFSITDASTRIYDEHLASDSLADPDPMHQSKVALELYGRTWMIDLRTNLAFRLANTYSQPTLILVGGLLIEALIIAMLVIMSRANNRAVAYADRVTADLRTEKLKLAATNAELEQFAYVASHDLRTPIRGIGGLTEMLREDLDSYLTRPDANPDISKNLDHIAERVSRMTHLTHDIMQFSRVGSTEKQSKPLNLMSFVSEMHVDFSLAPEQLTVTSPINVLTNDAFNLRRVLENLVSNAVKYQDGTRSLKIEITVRVQNGRLEIDVSDNGPGIASEYHARIFNVFQTLQVSDTPESTGIGLAIVKKMVEQNNGTIGIKSTLGNGASFQFSWPENQSTAMSRPPAQAAA